MTEGTGADDLRVGDDERRAVDERLHRAVGAGQLSLTEYDERARDVWAARTRGDLAVLVRDLPGGVAVPVPPSTTTRRAVAVMSDERVQGPVAPGQAVEGHAVMGDRSVRLSPATGGPLVRLSAVAVTGSVTVRSRPPEAGTGVGTGTVAVSRPGWHPAPTASAHAPRRRRPGRGALVGPGIAGVVVLGVVGGDGAVGPGGVGGVGHVGTVSEHED